MKNDLKHLLALRTSRGFTMVEALVALVVLSIGLLGIAALYLDSLRAGRDALLRTQAINLAGDISDRIRANRVAQLSYVIAADGTATEVPACKTTTGCTAAELAATDLAEWKDQIARLLPSGTGAVGVTPVVNAPTQYDITLSWTQPGSDEAMVFSTRIEI